MKNLVLKFLLLISALLISCELAFDWKEPKFTDGSVLSGTEPIPEFIKQKLEGVYKLTKASNHFGNEVVFKWFDNSLSVFGSKSGTFLQLEAGHKDSSFYFEGTWRHFLSAEGGLIRLFINRSDGSINLFDSSTVINELKLSGSYGNGDSPLSDKVSLKYLRPFSDRVFEKDFYILAHRGGGRNSDYLSASENSLEIISLAEGLGANGIEIDVKLSLDNIPFLYHDKNINLRTARESLIWGPIEDFSFSQIRIFIQLKNGEQIPSLREALEHVLYETNLKFVWLDMKSEKNSMSYVIPIQNEIMNLASQMGRDLEIMVGLPTNFMLDNLLNYPDFENVLSLCELSLNDVRNTNSQVWAPRWTLGLQTSSVQQMHSEGRRAFTWTLDQSQFITQYVNESEFDGILTNHPTIVAFYHYAR